MKAWSYSSLTKFETCPRQYYLTKVARVVVEGSTEATEWGTRVHTALEERVRDKTPLPPWASQWEPLVAKFDRFGDRVFCELEMGLTKSFQPTGFSSDDCWYRGIIDVAIHGKRTLLGDWKTGKVKNDHDQLKLFAATYMSSHKDVQSCLTKYYWLKESRSTTLEIKRDEVPLIWQEFIPRVNRIAVAHEKDKWVPKPSGLCNGWCPVGPDHCEFWKPKRTNK